MARILVDANTLVKISATTSTPFTWITVGSVLDYSADHTLEGENKVTRFIFGSATGITTTTAGSPVSSYSLNVLLDLADTNGQNAMRAAYVSGAEIEMAFINGASAAGYHETVKVKSWADSASADGDHVEGSFTADGDGTITEFTGGLPS